MKPFLKWAGGKTQLIEEIRKVLPSHYSVYYEPFLGGGAIFLDLRPTKAIVSDINPQLIHTYKIIKDSVEDLCSAIDRIDSNKPCSKELYYSIRDCYNTNILNKNYSIEMAAQLIWLNHHCFNGLYRTNRRGEFNTPWNRTERYIPSYDGDNLMEISHYLSSNDIEIRCSSYVDILDMPTEGDLVFLDPPYVPVGKYGDFKRYSKEQFYDEDQIELSNLVNALDKRNVFFCLTNSNAELVHNLYSDYSITIIKTHRNINSKGAGRFGEDAIVIPRRTN